MTQFVGFAGNTEQQLRQWYSYLLAQDSVGVATDGVLAGLGVSQTGTASASVVVGKGDGVVQDTGLAGAIPLVLDTDLTLDVLTANPVGGLPRNDLVVFDSATVSGGSGGVRVIVGTPNASPTDPTVPATAVPLARLRHAASATTVPTAKIDDLRVTTSLYGGPFVKASATKAGKRTHWAPMTVGTGDASGYRTVTHGAGFTPTVITGTLSGPFRVGVDNITATTFRLQVVQTDGSGYVGFTGTFYGFCGE